MDYKTRKPFTCFTLILVIAGVSAILGCASAPDRHPRDFDQLCSGMRHFLLFPPEIGSYLETPDGKLVWQADGSRKAGGYINQAVLNIMEAHALEVESADPDSATRGEMHEIQALYRNVNKSIQLHTYGPQEFVTKRDAFDYGLGSIRELLDGSGSDALMLVLGQETISQHGRKTWLSIAIVAPSGRVAWYGLQGGRESVSLETPVQAAELVRKTLKTFLGDLS